MTERLRIAVAGIVQGVGFRPFVYGLATRLGVNGFVTNRAGDVVIEAEAEPPVLATFVTELRTRPPAAARIDRMTATRCSARDEQAFHIAASERADEQAAAVAPDVATCEACIAEVLDPSSRRHRYAFTSCAACGPRLTIVTEAPYDRARTTMASFAMCAACRAEYDDPADRRFHAQPIACPTCGPALEMPGEAETGARDAVRAAASVVRAGGIVAVKGLGGYHLACDARRADVIAVLRQRKHRDAKPFAVMVADVPAARALVHLGELEEQVLASPARPIVLARKRTDAKLAANVAPGVGDLGVALPYTPLHHVLVAELGGMPLVMTSGNATDEPIAFDDDDARARLGAIADRFLLHDRPIHMRCDDSVVRVAASGPMIVRRARGYAPSPLRMPIALERPTLALGGHLKAAFALGSRDAAFVAPHIGDLDHAAAYDAFVTALDHFARLHRISPELVVCDRHPDYATTRLAAELVRDRGWELLAVQHHHAHFASALADAGLVEPALGVVWDGAGFGDDGATWGGEILVGDCAHVERVMHLAYVPQPGGDAAAREPARMAAAYLAAAGESVDLLGERGAAFAKLADHGAFAPPTSSVGRLFDAVAALVGVGDDVSFEGQAAMRLENLARGAGPEAPYPFELASDQLVVTPMIRAIASDLRRGICAARIARRFHTTLVELALQTCTQVAQRTGIADVVLSGGVFQNRLLADELPRALAAHGLRAYLQHRVPTNDGGLSFGQLAVAAAQGGS